MKEGQKLGGSQRWLQVAVNRSPRVLDRAIADAGGVGPDEALEWVSPLEGDGFREYRDQEFLDRLGVDLRSRPLEDFWPHRGPRWDALAMTSSGRYILVEAKANIREFNSSPSNATPASLRRIRSALDETKAFLYFVGDDTVPGREPVSREGWEAAISLANEQMGLRASSHWLWRHVFDIFVDVGDLRQVKWP